MWDASFSEAVAALVWGVVIGFFASIAIPVWTLVIWIVFGEGRSLRDLSWRKAPPTWVAIRRLFLLMPVIALIHPLPWAIGLIIWFLYKLLVGALHPMWWWTAVGFFGCVIWTGVMGLQGSRKNKNGL